MILSGIDMIYTSSHLDGRQRTVIVMMLELQTVCSVIG